MDRYLEKLPCGCIVFGSDALVEDGKRPIEREPVVIQVGCPKHDLRKSYGELVPASEFPREDDHR